jgi:hypothetical protein
MRIPTLISLTIAFAGLAACAGGGNRYVNEYADLRAECQARGGIFVPSGEATGRTVLDNVCEIPAASLLD